MKQKKDVLFLCQYFYPEYISSATLPFDTAQSLVDAGFTVGALCGYPKEYSLEKRVPLVEVYKGVYIKRLKYLQFKRTNIIGRLINYFSFTIAVLLNINELKRYRSIIVYSNPPILPLVASIANKFFKVKIVFVSYDIYPEIAHVTKVLSPNSLISKVMKRINNIVFKRLHSVVALSKDMKKFLLKHRPNLKEEQVVVIPNWYEDKGLPKSKYFIVNKMFKSLIEKNNMIVSYFGNMGTGQDIETIIEAMKILKNEKRVKFLFAGHGNKMQMLRDTVQVEKLDNAIIHDFLHGKDFEDALAISDCFLVSLAEGVSGLAVPSKTYSYMMTGKPVIAIMDQDAEIVEDLTKNNAGFALQSGESLKLVEAIYELLENEDKRKLMGENCRAVYLKKYTKSISTQKYVSLMKQVLED